jgi:hypothetical protein
MPFSAANRNAGDVMAGKRMQWKTLEPALRKLKKDELLHVLREAYEALPASRAVSVFGEYVDLTMRDASARSGKRATPRQWLESVQRFHADSLKGRYYESFNVNSKNYMETSEGTELWMRECRQLFDTCVTHSGKGHHAEVCAAMDLLFELLEQLDSGDDEIIFFADEGGSWQVGVDNGKVLPTYFASLAAVAEPEAYASRVAEVIDAHASYDSEKFLKAARKAANTAQRSALTNMSRKL